MASLLQCDEFNCIKIVDDKKEKTKTTYSEKLLQLIPTLEKGTYKKAWLREQIGFTNDKKFNERVLKHKDVVKYFKDNNIKLQGQSIIIP